MGVSRQERRSVCVVGLEFRVDGNGKGRDCRVRNRWTGGGSDAPEERIRRCGRSGGERSNWRKNSHRSLR